jgi:hypothetical protein
VRDQLISDRGLTPPLAVAVHVTVVPAASGNPRSAVNADAVTDLVRPVTLSMVRRLSHARTVQLNTVTASGQAFHQPKELNRNQEREGQEGDRTQDQKQNHTYT